MYFFIFGINNSGTTVVSQYLAAQADAYLPPFGNNEGQHVPAVKPIFRDKPWGKDKPIDWPFVRRAWDEVLAEAGKEIFVDASPPMLLWVDRIREEFADGHRAIILVANPYMQIASCLKNYTRPRLTAETIRKFTQRWLFKARHQARNIQTHKDIPYIQYEAFCANPGLLNTAFGIPQADGSVAVDGKSGRRRLQEQTREIRDLSTRTMAFLKPEEIGLITQRLSRAPKLVKGLGYTLMTPEEFEARLEADPEQTASGREARARWSKLRPK